MKRFLVFSGEDYYPNGGWEDFHGSFDTLEEAKDSRPKGDWAHILDTETADIVAVNWWEKKVSCPHCAKINTIGVSEERFICVRCHKPVEVQT